MLWNASTNMRVVDQKRLDIMFKLLDEAKNLRINGYETIYECTKEELQQTALNYIDTFKQKSFEIAAGLSPHFNWVWNRWSSFWSSAR